jgi:hypothetical protein
MGEETIQEWIVGTITIVIPSFIMTMMLMSLFLGTSDIDVSVWTPILIVNFMQSQIINYFIYKNEKHK